MSEELQELLKSMDKTDKDICNFQLVFSEMLKNEINAADEHEIYKKVMKVIRKYQKDEKCITAINEFFSAISEGADLKEIMNISIDEASSPSTVSDLIIDDSCQIKQKEGE